MAHYLPPAILALFEPRPPMEYRPPLEKRKMPSFTGLSQFVERFKDPIPPPVKLSTPHELKVARAAKKKVRAEARLKRHIAKWDPSKLDQNPVCTKDAYKTLFVSRLSYEVSEEDLKEEFEYYGGVSKVRIVADKKGKSRGFAFVEFERSKDLKEAYKDADGRKVKGRRILVDVERGRTVRNWKPRRLGGGLGGTRIGGPDVNQKWSGREPPKASRLERTGTRDHRAAAAGGGDRDRGGDRPRDRDRGGDRHGGGDRDHRKDRDKGEKDKRGGGGGGGDRDKDRRRKSKDRDRGERSDRSDRGERTRDSGRSDRDRVKKEEAGVKQESGEDRRR